MYVIVNNVYARFLETAGSVIVSDPTEPTRTLALSGPALLRATRAVLADRDADPDNLIVTP